MQEIILDVFLIAGAVLIAALVLFYGLYYIVKRWRKSITDRTDKAIVNHLKNVDHGGEYTSLDETPKAITAGERVFILKPLKYKHVVKLFSLFSKVLNEIQSENNADMSIDKVVEKYNEDVMLALAYIIYINDFPDAELATEALEVTKLKNYLRYNLTMNELSRIISVIMMQNDVEQFLNNFGRFVKKKP
ncbi:hypothetical protein HN680_08080 [Candidatus Peregrinibacteria bacterium]|nr:hypothetical protein [Candidatus Peregrinibacteria bacterium]